MENQQRMAHGASGNTTSERCIMMDRSLTNTHHSYVIPIISLKRNNISFRTWKELFHFVFWLIGWFWYMNFQTDNYDYSCYWRNPSYLPLLIYAAMCWWLMASFELISKHESKQGERWIMKSASSSSCKQLSMQNMSCLDFSVLSQQIMGSINMSENLHKAAYFKEITL